MANGTVAAAVALCSALALAPARADDEWDASLESDDGAFTDNVLLHGTDQVHDLQAPVGSSDQDWYLVRERPFSSYQMVVDGITPFLELQASDLQRLDATGALLDLAFGSDGGRVLSLQWQHGAGPADTFVRVNGAECGGVCLDWDRYRIRFYDTTYTLPRFNNSGTQATVLLVQNTTDRTCLATYHFFSEGRVLTTPPQFLPPRALNVFSTATFLPGRSGSLRVAHDCGYGGLSGKAVALEPATGFTFDTPLVARPN
jgi:hypothetical protein